MQFKAGIGCKDPLFCEIAMYCVTAIFGGLFIWFIIFLIQSHFKSKHQSVKKRRKGRSNPNQKRY